MMPKTDGGIAHLVVMLEKLDASAGWNWA